ncbi:MAG: methyltransferase domain-containing protein [Deltaproteobacteria bacterium]|nr:methyltransferase domain-containing protein [Deltaproteobacteria bacterium]
MKSLEAMGPHQRILDIPAGHGQFTEDLRRLGHEVVPADFLKNQPDYIRVNMNCPLPFQTDEFDVVICLEGIEHVLEPLKLVAELIRITRPSGRVYLSTPNIMNYYSRLQFLLTGTFLGFSPFEASDPVVMDLEQDPGHVTPVSYNQLRFYANYCGAKVHSVLADRYKRKILLPLFAALYLIGRPWSWLLVNSSRTKMWRERNREIYRHINSAPMLFGRSMIVVLEKQGKSA